MNHGDASEALAICLSRDLFVAARKKKREDVGNWRLTLSLRKR
jgi:hypothetical protein